MNDETGVPQVRARLIAKPADDCHPAVGTLVINQHFPAQVMIEMDLVPRLLQPFEALLDSLHPQRTWVRGQEGQSSIRRVIQKQDPWHIR